LGGKRENKLLTEEEKGYFILGEKNILGEGKIVLSRKRKRITKGGVIMKYDLVMNEIS